MMGLHCAHVFSRGCWSTRFDPDNAVSACYGCHDYWGRHPEEFKEWFIANFGPSLYDSLLAKSKRPAYKVKKRKAEIAAYYRGVLEKMRPGEGFAEWTP